MSIAHRLSTIKSADLILVLKDGQIAEQGSHTELLAKGGIFASMWADQVSAIEDGTSSLKKGSIVGYNIGEEAQAQPEQILTAEALVATPEAQTSALPAEEPVAETEATPSGQVEEVEEVPAPATAPIAFPSSDPEDEATTAQDASVSFPVADSPSPAAAAFAFPGSDTSSQPGTPSIGGTQSPGVTFQNAPTPARSGTPDVDADGKRRRTLSTQGIQRLARRISVSGRRQGSVSSIPTAVLNALKRDGSSRESSGLKSEVSKDGNGEVTGEGSSVKDSPAASIASDLPKAKKKDKKKDAREKKRKSTGQV